jgi:Baculovirus E66 occlusion-derived virus envelope protein
MLVLILVIVAVLLIIALFYKPTTTGHNIDNNIADDNYDNANGGNDELQRFENFYRHTLPVKFKQRTTFQPHNSLRPFAADDGDADDNIVSDLLPFTNVNDFAELLNTLNTYSILLCNGGVDECNFNDIIAEQLSRAIEILYKKLPMPAPTQRLPWNMDDRYWYVFSVALPECLMQLCIVLRAYGRDHSRIVADVISSYVPEPNLSLGWRRGIGFSTRMCLPFVYAQMLGGAALRDVVEKRTVANILRELKHETRDIGTGIRGDFVNFVDSNVRNYSMLIENYFTFDYYNALFGDDLVQMENIDASVHLVGNDRGILHPALAYKNGQYVVPALRHIMDYAPGIFSADHSKIVTVRNENYYTTLVCPVNGVAYYQANYDYRKHALLWTMTKRIWPHNSIIVNDTYGRGDDVIKLESGMILMSDDPERVPADDVLLSPNTVMSFLPNPGFTGIAVTADCAAAASYSKFDALNIEYYSYTVFHRTGMLQLYDRVKALSSQTDCDAACVIMVRDKCIDDDDDNIHVHNNMVAKHHNIINYRQLCVFDVKDVDDKIAYLRQTIPQRDINSGTGTVCYSLCVRDDATTSIVMKLEGGNKRHTYKVVTQNGAIECVFDFPFLLVKNNETRHITINNAYSVTRHVHTIHFDDVRRMLGYVSLSVDNLMSDNIARTEFEFVYRNSSSNQFAFVY